MEASQDDKKVRQSSAYYARGKRGIAGRTAGTGGERPQAASKSAGLAVKVLIYRPLPGILTETIE